MSIETIAMEYGAEALSGIAGTIIGWWANKIRVKRAKALKDAAKVAVIVLVAVMANSCATIENLVLAADEEMNAPRIPDGWDIYWQTYDPAGGKADLTGYYRLPELRPKGNIPKKDVGLSEIEALIKTEAAKEGVQ